MTKFKLYFLFLIALLVSSAVIYETYALLETDVNMETNVEISDWVVKVNNILLSGEKTRTSLSRFHYTTSTKVDDGYIAPGRNGYADILLDTTGTEVAVRIDVTFDENAVENENITFDVSLLDGTVLTRTDKSTYSKVLNLSDLSNNMTLRVNVIWDDDEEYDETDSKLGLSYNSKIVIPIDINVTQYLGEELTEYQE